MELANERARTTATLVVLAVVGAACSAGVTELDRETEAPLQTDRLTYNLHQDEVAIPFTYRNDTGRTVYQLNVCGRAMGPTVYRPTAEGWIPAETSLVPLCLSVTAVPIPPGETYEDTVRFLPDRDLLGSRSVSGIYRCRGGPGSSTTSTNPVTRVRTTTVSSFRRKRRYRTGSACLSRSPVRGAGAVEHARKGEAGRGDSRA